MKVFFLFSFIIISLGVISQPSGDSVMEPRKVGIPPSDAYIGLSLLETGEIRHYNYGEQAEPGSFYLSSRMEEKRGNG